MGFNFGDLDTLARDPIVVAGTYSGVINKAEFGVGQTGRAYIRIRATIYDARLVDDADPDNPSVIGVPEHQVTVFYNIPDDQMGPQQRTIAARRLIRLRDDFGIPKDATPDTFDWDSLRGRMVSVTVSEPREGDDGRIFQNIDIRPATLQQ